MLVIISDLHLTDGTCGATLPAGAFQLFVERLRDLAIAASYRSDGVYRPVEEIELVLLGDVLDMIRSAAWLSGDIRPWDHAQSPGLVQMVQRITADILHHNEPSLRILRGLTDQTPLRIPPANRLGQPVYQTEGEPVPIRIHYLVGNHDWFLHVPGAGYDALRQVVIERLGLAQRHDTPFPHDPAESQSLLDLLRAHKVFARHGDIYDPFNFEGDRCASSLGDAIVIELLNRFPVEVERELGHDLSDGTLAGLKEIDNLRPSLLAPVWVDGLLERTCPTPAVRKQVKAIWDRLADRFLQLDFVRARDTWNPFDIVDGLESVLKFSKRLSIGWASAVVNFLSRLRGRDDGSYYQHALAEQDFRNRRAKHIVYGHTHLAEYVPLDASYAEGYVLNQGYFNSGTWRRVHRATQFAPGEHEFIASESLTYLAFFQGDERSGRPYETWTGNLGINPLANTILRVDAPHVRAASGARPLAPIIPAPHFAPARTPAGIVPTKRS